MTFWGSVLVAIFVLVISREYVDLMRPVARMFARLAARLQGQQREQYRAEWLAELAYLHKGTDRSGVFLALGFVFSATRMRGAQLGGFVVRSLIALADRVPLKRRPAVMIGFSTAQVGGLAVVIVGAVVAPEPVFILALPVTIAMTVYGVCRTIGFTRRHRKYMAELPQQEPPANS